MHPVICQLGPFTIYSYGLMVALGFLAALFFARRSAPNYGIDPALVSNLCFLFLVLGIIGARLLYVILHFSQFKDNLLEIVLLNRGGLSLFGGLFVAALGGAYYLKKKGLPALKTLDFLSPYFALAQSIGRIGCFLNGCCFGYIGPVPVQLASSLILFFIFLLLKSFQKRPHQSGSVFCLYLLLYSAKRFSVEFFRFEERLFFAGLSIFQWISIITFILSLIVLMRMRQAKG